MILQGRFDVRVVLTSVLLALSVLEKQEMMSDDLQKILFLDVSYQKERRCLTNCYHLVNINIRNTFLVIRLEKCLAAKQK